jgi:hypothetical protein
MFSPLRDDSSALLNAEMIDKSRSKVSIKELKIYRQNRHDILILFYVPNGVPPQDGGPSLLGCLLSGLD